MLQALADNRAYRTLLSPAEALNVVTVPARGRRTQRPGQPIRTVTPRDRGRDLTPGRYCETIGPHGSSCTRPLPSRSNDRQAESSPDLFIHSDTFTGLNRDRNPVPDWLIQGTSLFPAEDAQ